MRDFSLNRFEKASGMPHTVDLNLPGGCDEVVNYAAILNRAYLALETDIKNHKVCYKKTSVLKKDTGSEDSPGGVKDLDPCSVGKDPDQSVKEYLFTDRFYETWNKLIGYSKGIVDCSSVYGTSPKTFWADLELYEQALDIYKNEYKDLGYSITQKNPLDEKPKAAAESLADTAKGLLYGLALLLGGFLVIDYAYKGRPSNYVASKV